MIVGYVRVSSFEQNEERQFNELKNFGVEKFFSEKISARAKVRPQFEEMMRFLRESGLLVVSELNGVFKLRLKNVKRNVGKMRRKCRTLKKIRWNGFWRRRKFKKKYTRN